MSRLHIYAPGVHVGGGKVLLDELLQSQAQLDKGWLLCDQRYSLPKNSEFQILRCRPDLASRSIMELRLRPKVMAEDRLLCFSNLPPSLRFPCRTQLFVQHRLLIDTGQENSDYRSELKLRVQRQWMRSFKKNVDEYVVQIPSMAHALKSFIGQDIEVLIEAFAPRPRPLPKPSNPLFDLMYVGTTQRHKHLKEFLEALRLLGEAGVSLKVLLVTDTDSEVNRRTAALASHHEMTVFSNLQREQVLEHYPQARALIFPSSYESFGLPLVEAQQAQLDILASETDFVREVCVPKETFDPRSPLSIQYAIERYLKTPRVPSEVSDGTGFFSSLLR